MTSTIEIAQNQQETRGVFIARVRAERAVLDAKGVTEQIVTFREGRAAVTLTWRPFRQSDCVVAGFVPGNNERHGGNARANYNIARRAAERAQVYLSKNAQ